MNVNRLAWATALLLSLSIAASASTAVATYTFANTLGALEGGAPALAAVDPDGQSSFLADTVFGSNRTVYNFLANNQQAGLTLDTTALLSSGNYSVEILFRFDDVSGGPSGYKRVLSNTVPAVDPGWYVHFGNMDVFTAFNNTGSASIAANAYYHTILTNDASSGNIAVYVNGGLDLSVATTVMNLDAGHRLSFFLDDGVPYQEFSSGDVALIRLYDGVLNAREVAARAADPFAGLATSGTPEPATWFSGIAAVALVTLARRRR